MRDDENDQRGPDDPDGLDERLKGVQQSDLNESKVNEDFVEWLKTKGPTWLLVILVALSAYLGIVRYKQGKVERRSKAWVALSESALPGSFEDVAAEFGEVDQVANYARLGAARQLLRSVQTNQPLATGPDAILTEVALTDAQRTEYLERAARQLDAILAEDDGRRDFTLFAVNALNGKAAIAECQNNIDGARTQYESAAARAGDFFPGLATQARARAANAADNIRVIEFASLADLQAATVSRPVPTPVSIDNALRSLILPEVDGDDS